MPTVEGGPASVRPLWVHEIKHDGYRPMVRADVDRVRCFTRNGRGPLFTMERVMSSPVHVDEREV